MSRVVRADLMRNSIACPPRDRWERAIEDRALDSLRSLPRLEARADRFLKVLATEKTSANACCGAPNDALGMD